MEGLFYERAALAALGRIFGYVPTVGLSLYEHVGSARDIFSLGPKELSSLLGHYSPYSASINMETLEKEIGRKADRRRKLYNGTIETQFYQYHGERPPKTNLSR